MDRFDEATGSLLNVFCLAAHVGGPDVARNRVQFERELDDLLAELDLSSGSSVALQGVIEAVARTLHHPVALLTWLTRHGQVEVEGALVPEVRSPAEKIAVDSLTAGVMDASPERERLRYSTSKALSLHVVSAYSQGCVGDFVRELIEASSSVVVSFADDDVRDRLLSTAEQWAGFTTRLTDGDFEALLED